MKNLSFTSLEKIDLGHRVKDIGIPNNGQIFAIAYHQKIIRLEVSKNLNGKLKIEYP